MTQQKEYYSITNKLYSLKDATEWDYATLATIATFNYPFISDENEKTTEIKIKPFKVADIYNALNMSNASRNKKATYTKIENAIVRLAKANVIKIDDVVKSDGRENTFIVKQVVDVKGQYTGFASVTADEYFNIVLKIEKDAEKIKALACYVSIIQRIFKQAKDELAKQAKFNISSLNYYVNWESQENIGSKYGMGRKAVSKSIELLVEVEAIAIKAIKQKGAGKEVKYIYTKHSDSEKLDLYVQEQIEKGEYTKVVKAKAVVKETVKKIDPVVEEVVEDVATEQLQALVNVSADEIVREHTEPIRAVKVEKKEDKVKVINITNDDERMKKLEALASFKNVKNVDEKEEESKADEFDLLAEYRTDKKIATV